MTEQNTLNKIATDITISGIIRAEQQGFKVSHQIHDETVIKAPKNSHDITTEHLRDITSAPIDQRYPSLRG